MQKVTLEVWKAIRDYEGLYEVSNWGRVKSLKFGKEKILRLVPNDKGYLTVNLCNDGVPENKRVHILVAQAFIANPNGCTDVHHKDHDKTNNRVENLEWMDEGEHHAMHNKESKSKVVYQYTLDGLLVNAWKSVREAERVLGFNHGFISKCCLDKLKTAYGYKWSYKSKPMPMPPQIPH